MQDAVKALKARLSDATAALQISHSEALRLRTRVADLKAAVSSVRPADFSHPYTITFLQCTSVLTICVGPMHDSWSFRSISADIT